MPYNELQVVKVYIFLAMQFRNYLTQIWVFIKNIACKFEAMHYTHTYILYMHMHICILKHTYIRNIYCTNTHKHTHRKSTESRKSRILLSSDSCIELFALAAVSSYFVKPTKINVTGFEETRLPCTIISS